MPWDSITADGIEPPLVEIFLESAEAATQVMIQHIDFETAGPNYVTLHLLLADGSKTPVRTNVSGVVESDLRPADIAWIRLADRVGQE